MALYGTLKAALLFWKKLSESLKLRGFTINPYDWCIANKTINGKHCTIVWHVDDLKASHVDAKVNDGFLEWLKKTYGDEEIGKVKAVRGPIHDYLGMTLDFTKSRVLKLDMSKYIQDMIEDFPDDLDGKEEYPWNDKLFKIDENDKKLDKLKSEEFHTFVAKALFLSKRARPDIQPGIPFLTTRVKEPGENDWNKLKWLMNFLKKTKNDVIGASG